MTSQKLQPAATAMNACAAQAMGPPADDGANCCYPSQLLLCGGRPLFANGAPIVASLALRSDWS